jgi:tellurite resistance protein
VKGWEVIDSEKRRMSERIESYKELRVFQKAMDTAMKIFESMINTADNWLIK